MRRIAATSVIIVATIALGEGGFGCTSGTAECSPPCSPGFLCSGGSCVPPCNPMCPANKACDVITDTCIDLPADASTADSSVSMPLADPSGGGGGPPISDIDSPAPGGGGCDPSSYLPTTLFSLSTAVPWAPQVPVDDGGGGCWCCDGTCPKGGAAQPTACWATCPGTCISTRYCGPTAYLMVRNYFLFPGTDPTSSDIAAEGVWLQSNAMNYKIPGGGNEHWATDCGSGDYTDTTLMAALFQGHAGFPPPYVKVPATVCDIYDSLQRGHPPIIHTLTQMDPLSKTSHWMVVTGISSTNVRVNDPGRSTASGEGRSHIFPLANLLSIWNTWHSSNSIMIEGAPVAASDNADMTMMSSPHQDLAPPPPSCTDGVANGGETDVDCGGNTTCPRCGVGRACLANTDCMTSDCSQTKCVASPTCSDGILNGAETDVDCGGGTCQTCALGKKCLTSGDCSTNSCQSHVCAATCSDGVKDGTETDIDCGGSCPTKCGPNRACLTAGDCTSTICSNHVCAPQPTCSCMDGDGDGYYPTSCKDSLCSPGGDCDDTNATVHPGAKELADYLDNDCDGVIDNGVRQLFTRLFSSNGGGCTNGANEGWDHCFALGSIPQQSTATCYGTGQGGGSGYASDGHQLFVYPLSLGGGSAAKTITVGMYTMDRLDSCYLAAQTIHRYAPQDFSPYPGNQGYTCTPIGYVRTGSMISAGGNATYWEHYLPTVTDYFYSTTQDEAAAPAQSASCNGSDGTAWYGFTY